MITTNSPLVKVGAIAAATDKFSYSMSKTKKATLKGSLLNKI
jgi:hypothetical protein